MAKQNTLIYRAQAGDEGAFADLMRSYHAFVYAIVIGVVDNSHDAEEVMQDAFLNAYQGLKQLQDATKFKSWLAEITRNCARQWLRQQRGETVSLDEVSGEVLQTADSPEERLTQQEQRELIRRTMETLPPRDRDIAHAFYLEGASYDELTSTHGLSYNAIALRLFRIKQKLSKRLQYLLTGIFVSPAMTLKKLYSGGLTVMKVGTVPKITVGAAALLAVIFIGYIGFRQMNSPTVEERVYLSPWEEGAARPQGLAAQTDSTQDTESGDIQPQIASATSSEERQLIDDLFTETEETDRAQIATEVEFEPDADQSLITDTSTLLDDMGQSAEDVMYTFMEAWRNADFEAMLPLLTETLKRDEEGGNLYEGSDRITDEDVVERFEEIAAWQGYTIDTTTIETIVVESEAGEHSGFEHVLKTFSQADIANSKYVGDEFHFQLSMPAMELPEMPLDVEIGTETPISVPDYLVKMRKVDGLWRIYEYGWKR